jgi:protein-disulfide isomerase
LSDRNDAPTKKKSLWPLVIGLPLIAVIAAAAIFFTAGGENAGTERASEAPEESEETPAPSEGGEGGDDPGNESSLEHPALGDEDAPVVMVEFSDYQ